MSIRVFFSLLAFIVVSDPSFAAVKRTIYTAKDEAQLESFKKIAYSPSRLYGALGLEIRSSDERFMRAATNAIYSLLDEFDVKNRTRLILPVLMLKKSVDGKSVITFVRNGTSGLSGAYIQAPSDYRHLSSADLTQSLRSKMLSALKQNLTSHIKSMKRRYAVSVAYGTKHWGKAIDATWRQQKRKPSDKNLAKLADLELRFYNRIYSDYLLDALAGKSQGGDISDEDLFDILSVFSRIIDNKPAVNSEILRVHHAITERLSLQPRDAVVHAYFERYAKFAPNNAAYVRGLKKARAHMYPTDLGLANWRPVSASDKAKFMARSNFTGRYPNFGPIAKVERIDMSWLKNGGLLRIQGKKHGLAHPAYVADVPHLGYVTIDGKGNYFNSINKGHPPLLTLENVRSYLWSYTFFLYSKGSPFLIVESANDTFLPANLNALSRSKIKKHARPMTCSRLKDPSSTRMFKCNAFLFYKRSLLSVVFAVSKSGHVEMLSDRVVAKQLSPDVSLNIDPAQVPK